jgi:hypothetical protein
MCTHSIPLQNNEKLELSEEEEEEEEEGKGKKMIGLLFNFI